MSAAAETEPVIVFTDIKTKASRIKDITKRLQLPFYQITDDSQVQQVCAVIKSQSRGVLAVLQKYGRGTDIAFKTDCFVVVAFKPASPEVLRQMTGRSSRRMGKHVSKVIVVDPNLDAIGMETSIDN